MKPKLCIDCKYHVYSCCMKTPSAVDGGPHDGWRGWPSIQRADNWINARIFGSCGKEGRFFEPKKSNV